MTLKVISNTEYKFTLVSSAQLICFKISTLLNVCLRNILQCFRIIRKRFANTASKAGVSYRDGLINHSHCKTQFEKSDIYGAAISEVNFLDLSYILLTNFSRMRMNFPS